MSLSREPARPHEPGYPTFAEFDPGRRAALRAIGLAGLSAVGLNLVGCPGGGGTGTPTTGTGTGPATDTGTPPKTDTDWVPWRETETGPPDVPPRNIPLGGAPPPSDWNRPIAIVVGGGPIEVTFSDGAKASLAVALVVQRSTTPDAVKADAPEHTAAVKAAAKTLPRSTLDGAEGLAALEARIQEEVLKAVPGLVIEGVQAAPAVTDAPPPPSGAGARRRRRLRRRPRAPGACAPAPAASPPAAGDGAAAAKPAKAP
jgi:hypothetical protein